MIYFTKNAKGRKFSDTSRGSSVNHQPSGIIPFPSDLPHRGFKELITEINEYYELMIEEYPNIVCKKLEAMLQKRIELPADIVGTIDAVVREMETKKNHYARRILADLCELYDKI